MNHSFLTVRGLDYSIDGTEILQDVSLEVPEGTFVGLIGPNGCGKSTLLKNIYKTYRPQKDTVYIDGKDVVSLSAKEMARQAAVVAQENQTEFDLEVLDMVMYGRYAHRRFLEKETEEDLAICRRFRRSGTERIRKPLFFQHVRRRKTKGAHGKNACSGEQTDSPG